MKPFGIDFRGRGESACPGDGMMETRYHPSSTYQPRQTHDLPSATHGWRRNCIFSHTQHHQAQTSRTARLRRRPERREALSVISLSVSAILQGASGRPLAQAAALILGTFILEDAATVVAGMQVQDGKLVWPLALAALYVGVILGDMGLYGLGKLAALWPMLFRIIRPDRRARGKEWLQGRVFRVVFISRFLPGARLPTYTTCGFLSAGFLRFSAAASLATLLWTTTLFGISLRVGEWLMNHLGAWRWLGAITFIVVVLLAGRLAAGLQRLPE